MEHFLNVMMDYPAIREISSGIWACLSISLTLLFGWYSWKYVRDRPWDIATKAAVALFFFCLGNALRSVTQWMQWMSNNRETWELTFWMQNKAFFILSVVLSILGATLAIKAFVPKYKRKWVELATLPFSVIIPVLIYWFV